MVFTIAEKIYDAIIKVDSVRTLLNNPKFDLFITKHFNNELCVQYSLIINTVPIYSTYNQ